MGIDNITGLLFFRFKTLSECVSWNNTYFFDGIGQSVFPPDNKPPTKAFKMPRTFLGETKEKQGTKERKLGEGFF